LTPDEQARLYRARSASVDDVVWTEADLSLLDEVRALLGSPSGRRAGHQVHEHRSYGHIVVDEAQDLSPMQVRMLGRRSLSGSMTIVGDIAQATGPWAPVSWDEVLTHLPARRSRRVVELTVNYRTPREIMALAARVLNAMAPDMSPPDSVRTTGLAPRFVEAAGDLLVETVARLAASEAAIVSGESTVGGNLAVICPPSRLDSVGDALSRGGVPFGTVAAGALDTTVTLLSLESAKGLEFDSVLVVEPGRLAAEAAQGLHSLYVAITRSTRRLTVVYSESLPEPLAS
jgi:DNA helicase IV